MTRGLNRPCLLPYWSEREVLAVGAKARVDRAI